MLRLAISLAILFALPAAAQAQPSAAAVQSAPSLATSAPRPHLAGRWSVAFSAGNPQMGAIAVARTIGSDWRVGAEAGTLMLAVLGGVVRVDRHLRRLGPVEIFASATAAVVHTTGLSPGGAGPSDTGVGVGVGLGLEHEFSFGMTLSASLGAMVGDWGGVYGDGNYIIPEFTMYRIGYAW